MGQKDIAEKYLEDYNDEFADIVNVLLFNGRQIVSLDSLQKSGVKTQYKAENHKLHEMERDTAKYWADGKVNITVFGMENQTKPEKYMPVRVIGYDGSSYREQLLSNKGICPVITLVLYFGKKHWNQPENLKSLMEIPEGLEQYVNDYKIHVFEISWLTDEQVHMFQSDFKYVAEFFVKTRENNEYQPEPGEIRHVDAVLKLLSAVTGDDRFENIEVEGNGGIGMCEVLDKIEQKGIEQGIEQGILTGADNEQKKIVRAMRENGCSNEEIARLTAIPLDKVNRIL